MPNKRPKKGITKHILVGLGLCFSLIFYLFRNPPSTIEVLPDKLNVLNENLMTDRLKNRPLETNIPPKPEVNNINLRRNMVSKTTENKDIWNLIRKMYDLANSTADTMLQKLVNDDPFQLGKDPSKFNCPVSNDRLTLPDNINYDSVSNFKSNKRGSWMMFQHVRKAGGTAFCDLAKSNLSPKHVPPYYCMPDDRGSLAIAPWDDYKYISSYMTEHDYRIAANEWDAFFEEMFTWPDVVLATSLRDPRDRWYSQYR